MENHDTLWKQCLQLIRGKVDPHVFDVWFTPLAFDSYTPQKKTVMLQVPNRYVYEYMEEVQTAVLQQALGQTFGPGTRLNYRITKANDSVPGDSVAKIEYPIVGQIPRFQIPNARERMENGLKHYLGDKAQWLPCYDKVVQWLSDNKGRGLLCIGTAGLGKTLICEKILPVILGRNIKTFNASDMNTQIEDLLKERAVIIDDLGKEPAKLYGQPDTSFYRLCDAAERQGILLIITTNLSTTPVSEANRPLYPLSIQERYGNDVLSRLRATTTVVGFKGEDMRK